LEDLDDAGKLGSEKEQAVIAYVEVDGDDDQVFVVQKMKDNKSNERKQRTTAIFIQPPIQKVAVSFISHVVLIFNRFH
jgi:hypothetical protein